MYQTISPYYDWVMAHVNYKDWSVHINLLLKEYNIKYGSILELAAGTCPFGEYPISRNSNTVFTDISYLMLREAPPGLKQVAADCKALPFKNKFDLAVMVYDSLNYLQSVYEVEKCLEQVAGVLPKEGHFIFDVTTEYNSKTYFEDSVLVDSREDCHITRESWYDEKEKKQYNQFTFFIQNKESSHYEKAVETHVQQIYTMTELRKIIRSSPFQLVCALDGFTLKKSNRYSDRVHLILRKK